MSEMPSAGGASDGGGGFNFGAAGGAVSDIFGAIGDFSEAGAYSAAAKYAGQNALLSKESTAIQEFQAGRMITQTLGKQQAEVAGAGLRESGSSLDLLHSSMEQGALTKNLISLQGQINENGYLEQQAQFRGMANAAKAGGIGSIIGAALKIGAMFI